MKTLRHRRLTSVLLALCLALSCQAGVAPRSAGTRSMAARPALATAPTLWFAPAPLSAEEQAALAQRNATTLTRRTDLAGASDRTKVVWIVVGVAVVALAIAAAAAAESVNHMNITINP